MSAGALRTPDASAPGEIAARVGALGFGEIARQLDASGCALIDELLTPAQCRMLAALYARDDLFRSRVAMARHGFGSGEYKYFDYPLPALVAELREALFPPLAALANRWQQALGHAARYPDTLADYLAQCHAVGQTRPTPLLLKYAAGDYNRLHQDLYGEQAFGLQATVLLSAPGEDFTGGEFVLTEQRPRRQSRVEVVPLYQGSAVVFAVNQRPVRGTRGVYRVTMRHGVSRVRSGERYAAGIIFHDAQ